jgi:hypothetical protein
MGMYNHKLTRDQKQEIVLLTLRIEFLEQEQEWNNEKLKYSDTINEVQTATISRLTDAIKIISNIINLSHPTKTEELKTPEPTKDYLEFRCLYHRNKSKCWVCNPVKMDTVWTQTDSVRAIDLTTSFKLKEK